MGHINSYGSSRPAGNRHTNRYGHIQGWNDDYRTATLNGSGQAAYDTQAISGGSRSLTAVYEGDATYTGSTSTVLTQTVNKASTSIAVTSDSNPSTFGQAVTLRHHLLL